MFWKCLFCIEYTCCNRLGISGACSFDQYRVLAYIYIEISMFAVCISTNYNFTVVCICFKLTVTKHTHKFRSENDYKYKYILHAFLHAFTAWLHVFSMEYPMAPLLAGAYNHCNCTRKTLSRRFSLRKTRKCQHIDSQNQLLRTLLFEILINLISSNGYTRVHESSLPVAHPGYQVLSDILFSLGLIANALTQCSS